MRAACVALAVACVLGAATAAKLPDWQQCGGLGGLCKDEGTCVDGKWKGAKCGKGSACVRNTDQHWMCAPASYDPDSAAALQAKAEQEAEVAQLLSRDYSGKQKKLPNYQQCGGKGGDCDKKGAVCANAAWPGFACDDDSACTANSEYNWQCKPLENGQAAGTGGLIDKDGQAAIEKSEDGVIPRWKQCGGSTGACDKFGDDACADCAFPGTACEKGYVCGRVVEHFWQCVPDDMGVQGPRCSAKRQAVSAMQASCPAPEGAEDMEVDGTYLDSISLSTELPYAECCAACADADGCKAFQVGEYAGNGTTCDFFSSVTGFVPATGSTAALLKGMEFAAKGGSTGEGEGEPSETLSLAGRRRLMML